MFVTLTLVVSVVAPVVVIIAALLRAPEAYENEQGLQIVKRSPKGKVCRTSQEVLPIFPFNSGACGANGSSSTRPELLAIRRLIQTTWILVNKDLPSRKSC